MPDEEKPEEQKTERFNMFMSPSEMKAIDDWMWKNRIRSKSEAVRRLCQIGLETTHRVVRLEAWSPHAAIREIASDFIEVTRLAGEVGINADLEGDSPNVVAWRNARDKAVATLHQAFEKSVGNERELIKLFEASARATSSPDIAKLADLRARRRHLENERYAELMQRLEEADYGVPPKPDGQETGSV